MGGIENGKAVRSGRVENLSVAPRQTTNVKLDLGKTCKCAEWLLNVKYVQKNREGLVPAGHVVAKAQLTLNPYKAPAMDLANVEEKNVAVVVPQIKDENVNRIVVKGENFNIQFNKQSGYMDKYEVNGLEMIKEGEAMTPNFWRAPTDNDLEQVCSRSMQHGIILESN